MLMSSRPSQQRQQYHQQRQQQYELQHEPSVHQQKNENASRWNDENENASKSNDENENASASNNILPDVDLDDLVGYHQDTNNNNGYFGSSSYPNRDS